MRFGASLMKKIFRNMWAELRECNMGLQWGWGEDCYHIQASGAREGAITET